MNIIIEISPSELLDKMSILKLKIEYLSAQKPKLQERLTEFENIWREYYTDEKRDVNKSIKQLEKINSQLWQVEDELRVHEKKKSFNSTFIELARSVYLLNDNRHSIKKEIDKIFNSSLSEEKNYSDEAQYEKK